MRYLVSYDLNKPVKNYPKLWAALEDLGAERILLSQWIICHVNTGASELRDHLKHFIDSDDRLIVVCLDSTGWAAWNPIIKLSTFE